MRNRKSAIREWTNRREFEQALRPILNGFARDKVNRFLESTWVAVRLGTVIPEQAPLIEARQQYERALRTTVEYLNLLADLPDIVERRPGGMLASLTRAIEKAGGAEAFLKAADRRRDENRQYTQEETAAEWQKVLNRRKTLRDKEHARLEKWDSRLAGEDRRDAATRWEEDAEQAAWEFNEAKLTAFRAVAIFRDDLRDLLEFIPERQTPGRKRADPGRVLTELAFAYQRIFAQPPRSTEGGTFHNLAVAVTGNKTPSRAVLAAVAAVRNDN